MKFEVPFDAAVYKARNRLKFILAYKGGSSKAMVRR